MSSQQQPQDLPEDRLVDRVLYGLDLQGESELLEALGDDFDAEVAAMERTLCAFQGALTAERAAEPPADLTARLEAAAMQHFSAPKQEEAKLAPIHEMPQRASASRAPWIAVAAALLLAVAGWWPVSPATSLNTSAELTAMLESAPEDLLRLDWIVLEDLSVGDSTKGEIIWSDSEQRGYMRFTGLRANDVTAEQYQLWIFDRAQKDEHPVDGGVFDIPAGAEEVIVPIDAKIEIQEAWQFAITVEKPGGVVVSERGRLPLLATTAS